MENSKWNDKRKTDAFKSTRKTNKINNPNNKIEKPTNTRVWKNKTQTESGNFNFNKNRNKTYEEFPNNIIEPRKWSTKPRTADNDNHVIEPRKWSREPRTTDNVTNTIEPRKWVGKTEHSNAFGSMGIRNNLKSDSKHESSSINSKWTAKREKRLESNDPFSNNNIFTPQVPEKKSFNKKIVITERKSKKQQEAEKKAMYDSFIKESFILKLKDTLGKKTVETDKDKDKDKITDSWDSGNNTFNYTEHLTEFDKWEKDLLEYVDGDSDDSDDSDDYGAVNKRRKQFFSGRLKHLYEHYKLPEQDKSAPKLSYDKSYYDKKHKSRLISRLRGLSVLPAVMVEDTQDNINEVYESLYEIMVSQRMSVGDISFDYNVENMLEIDNKTLRKEFYKLRKKYNSIKKIQKKLENKESVQKGEQDKYNSRHECIFLYHRLKYYDEYYMDGELNFTNNTN